MPASALVAETPYYVLKDGSRPLSPNVEQLELGIGCSVVYGFSDKRCYDKFLKSGKRALTPYPLVKSYLRDQDARNDGLKLVVLDAAEPSEPLLTAATMATVLAAHEKRTERITATHRLSFDKETDAYTVEEL